MPQSRSDHNYPTINRWAKSKMEGLMAKEAGLGQDAASLAQAANYMRDSSWLVQT